MKKCEMDMMILTGNYTTGYEVFLNKQDNPYNAIEKDLWFI